MTDQIEMHRNSGLRALSGGDLLTAQSEYVAALRLDGACFDAITNLAVVFSQSGRGVMAIAAARRAAAMRPDMAGAWHNLGFMLSCEGQWQESEAALRKALSIERTLGTLHALGLCLHALGQFDEAIRVYDEALKLSPDNIDLIDHRGQSLLGAGRLTEGLIDNKIRWQFIMCHPLMASPIAEWKGEELKGKTIVVLHEQGFGDMFQCVRWVPMLKTVFGAKHVILSVPDSVQALLRDNKLADEVIGIRGVPDSGFDSVDYKIPMMTVPALFNVAPDNIPGRPYIAAPKRPASLPRDKFKVGLVWGGKPMYAQDRWRSMDPMNLLPLVTMPDVNFYSLQADERAQQLWQSGLNAFVTDLAPRIRDWSDTAALVNELDLVVTVDTAPAHLAGAMGKPVALMIPEASCWRWLDHSTTTTPWYPSMAIFRQAKQGEWVPVIEAVTSRVQAMANLRKTAKQAA